MLFGARLGLWEPIEGFIYSRNYTNPIGYTIVGLSIATFTYLISKRHLIGKKKSVISLIIGLAILGPLISSKVSEKISYPPIHDISTDTVNPPLFITLTDNRPGAKNTLVYGGPEIAGANKLQRSQILNQLCQLSLPQWPMPKPLTLVKQWGGKS